MEPAASTVSKTGTEETAYGMDALAVARVAYPMIVVAAGAVIFTNDDAPGNGHAMRTTGFSLAAAVGTIAMRAVPVLFVYEVVVAAFAPTDTRMCVASSASVPGSESTTVPVASTPYSMRAASHVTVADAGNAYSETTTETGVAGLTYVGWSAFSSSRNRTRSDAAPVVANAHETVVGPLAAIAADPTGLALVALVPAYTSTYPFAADVTVTETGTVRIAVAGAVMTTDAGTRYAAARTSVAVSEPSANRTATKTGRYVGAVIVAKTEPPDVENDETSACVFSHWDANGRVYLARAYARASHTSPSSPDPTVSVVLSNPRGAVVEPTRAPST